MRQPRLHTCRSCGPLQAAHVITLNPCCRRAGSGSLPEGAPNGAANGQALDTRIIDAPASTAGSKSDAVSPAAAATERYPAMSRLQQLPLKVPTGLHSGCSCLIMHHTVDKTPARQLRPCSICGATSSLAGLASTWKSHGHAAALHLHQPDPTQLSPWLTCHSCRGTKLLICLTWVTVFGCIPISLPVPL